MGGSVSLCHAAHRKEEAKWRAPTRTHTHAAQGVLQVISEVVRGAVPSFLYAMRPRLVDTALAQLWCIPEATRGAARQHARLASSLASMSKPSPALPSDLTG